MGNKLKKAIVCVATFVAMAAMFSGGIFISLTSAAASEETSSVAIDETNFPDETFRGYVSEKFDSDADGVLSEEEIGNVTDIIVNSQGISNITGIEKFTSLTTLNCSENKLTNLDVSQNTELTYLNCENNKLTSLDVSQNTELTYLDCYYNKLTSLDVSQNTELTYLDCNNNNLTSLDVSQNTELTYFDCGGNNITNLDVSQNTELTELNCGGNKPTSLDVSRNTKLQVLYCGNNKLTSLDVSRNTELQVLDCGDNKLTSLDVSQNTSLTYLYCFYNKLTSLDVSHNTSLTYLGCYVNNLTSLDVSQNTDLTQLYCYSNKLTSLDVSQNTDLITLYCENNKLTSLDVSKNIALTGLGCQDNELTSLDVSKNTVLTSLYCENNKLTSLDVSKNTLLTYLDCSSNKYDVGTVNCTKEITFAFPEGFDNTKTSNWNAAIYDAENNKLKDIKLTNSTDDGKYYITYYYAAGDRYRVTFTLTFSYEEAHDYSAEIVDEKYLESAATCTKNAVYYKSCSLCGERSLKETFELQNTRIEHTLSKVEAKTATCLVDGNSEYWRCSSCDSIFKDENGENEVTFDDAIIKVAHNLTKVDKKAATCTEDGNTEYWKCSECGKYFSDEKGENEIAEADTVKKATGHSYKNYVSNNDGKAATCKTKGKTASKTATCSNGCGETNTILGTDIEITAHNYETEVIKATTRKDGSIVKKCTVKECGKVYSKTVIAYVKSATLSATAYTYTGKAIKPTVTIKDSKGNKLTTASYTVNYVNNTKVGKATVKITLKGNYSGTITRTFKINPKATSISALTATSKGFKVTWKKQAAQTTGYQIRYSTKSSMSGAKTVTVKKNSTTKAAVTKLTAKKKYYVQIRTYTKVNGVVYYSAWSKAKAVTTKK